ncbi:hypothetical protein [Chryseolinea sp. H1M3-3]|uniref:hypothetical protein n=1 Tax=Chryseolinea sp. H1M3-3 TaxID=3034144 RepID=UPI0023EDE1F4|nr:hypothetical protein [Chryseolinea sp. H1M3-3]
MKLAGMILVLVPFLVYGQEKNHTSVGSLETLFHHVSMFSQVEGIDNTIPDITTFIRRIEQKENPRNSVKFCRVLFHKTRHEFFRHYTQYASFKETLNHGNYNCLTGTALYAVLLQHFGIQFSIIETNYHIFLVASTDEGKVLFEATDPVHGFVTDPVEIEKRIDTYKKNNLQPVDASDKKYYEYAANLFNAVDLKQVRGLLHFNVSIDAYNQKKFDLAIAHLDKALDLYHSSRIREFSSVLLLAVIESQLDNGLKEKYLRQIHALRKRQNLVMASRMNP